MRKKLLTILLLTFFLPLSLLPAQEERTPAAKLLREALFAEEADRDLPKAEKGYREIVRKFDTDRIYAATAILRLGEILHQRGDTAEAERWFSRVLQEFPDQKAIVQVATTRLGDKAGVLLGARPARVDLQTEEIKSLSMLLEQSPDLLNTSRNGSTLLATAVSKGRVEVVEFLLNKGAQVDNIGQSPSALAISVKNGHLAVFERLLKAGAKLENGLLTHAVRSGNYAITEELLKAGANPNTVDSLHLTPKEINDSASFPSLSPNLDQSNDPFSNDRVLSRKPEFVSESYSEVSWTPLEIATFYRYTKLTDLLLANRAKSQKGKEDFTEELRFAIIDENSKLVAKLLKHGADPKSHWSQDQGRMNALSIASILGNAEIVKQLIQAGADVNANDSRNEYTPLFYATGPAVGVLLNAGADPNAMTRSGVTPLHITKDAAKAKELLEAGAKLITGNDSSISPITRADIKILDVLLATKPDLSRMEGPHTALGYASGGSRDFQVERIGKLIAAGADPNQVDKNGMTPLLIAVSYCNAEAVKALLQGGAKPNGVPDSRKPLSLLPAKEAHRRPNCGAVVRALIDAGADPNVLDSNNETILRKVAKNNDLETVQYLLKKGAALQVADKFAFQEAPDKSPTKTELFLATYLQPERRRGTIRVVSPEFGEIQGEVSAFVPAGEKLPKCPYSILEAFANCSANLYSFGQVTIWREGEADPMKFNLRKIIASGDPAQDIELEWGDLIQFSVAKSREEVAITKAEKEFLEDHLNRQVQFTLEGKTNQVNLRLHCVQLSNSELWVVEKPRMQSNYLQESRDLPFDSVKGLRLLQQVNQNSELFVLEIQAVERAGRKIDIPGSGQSTLWLESDDIVFLEKRAR